MKTHCLAALTQNHSYVTECFNGKKHTFNVVFFNYDTKKCSLIIYTTISTVFPVFEIFSLILPPPWQWSCRPGRLQTQWAGWSILCPQPLHLHTWAWLPPSSRCWCSPESCWTAPDPPVGVTTPHFIISGGLSIENAPQLLIVYILD